MVLVLYSYFPLQTTIFSCKYTFYWLFYLPLFIVSRIFLFFLEIFYDIFGTHDSKFLRGIEYELLSMRMIEYEVLGAGASFVCESTVYVCVCCVG